MIIRGSLLQPDLVLGDCILGLTTDVIQKHQLRGLILDVDETLVPLRAVETAQEVRDWVDQLRPLVPIWLVSNNVNAARIGRIAEYLTVPYITGAGKPSRRKLRQALDQMALPSHQVAMVGDRIFTDVLAGNRLGLFTILVEPMLPPGQTIQQRPLHNLEVLVSEWLGVSLQSSS